MDEKTCYNWRVKKTKLFLKITILCMLLEIIHNHHDNSIDQKECPSLIFIVKAWQAMFFTTTFLFVKQKFAFFSYRAKKSK